MWRSFRHYLYLISYSFGVSGRLGFVIATLLEYLHLYFEMSTSRPLGVAAIYL